MVTVPVVDNGLSARGQHFKEAGNIRNHFASVWENSYDAESNTNGVVNLGTAENYVMMPEVAKFVNEKVQFEAHHLDYGMGPWGSIRLRKAMANHMTKYFQPLSPVDPEDLVFATGCTSICDMLGFSIFEPGDGILLSRPIYQAFQRDFVLRAQIKPIFVAFHGEDQFTPEAVKAYEVSIKEAKDSGTNARALLICNPHNPLGRCYSEEALIALMKMCQKHSIHLIMDEIYALSVYKAPGSENVTFKSVLTIDTTQYIHPNYLHILYGFSKDIASGGLRLGCLWTKNKDLIAALASLTLFSWPSNIAEYIAIKMLEDHEWMKLFIKTNQTHLGERATLARSVLEEYKIPYASGASAGFFLWIDVRKFLGKGDPEKATWEQERVFKKRMLAKGVYLTSGESLTSEYPGFLRFCFVKNETEVREGLKRLKEALDEFNITESESGSAEKPMVW